MESPAHRHIEEIAWDAPLPFEPDRIPWSRKRLYGRSIVTRKSSQQGRQRRLRRNTTRFRRRFRPNPCLGPQPRLGTCRTRNNLIAGLGSRSKSRSERCKPQENHAKAMIRNRNPRSRVSRGSVDRLEPRDPRTRVTSRQPQTRSSLVSFTRAYSRIATPRHLLTTTEVHRVDTAHLVFSLPGERRDGSKDRELTLPARLRDPQTRFTALEIGW